MELDCTPRCSRSVPSLPRVRHRVVALPLTGGELLRRACGPGVRAVSVRGPLPFHLNGIRASLAVPLAAAKVPILALSTHDSDWLLVGNDHMAVAGADQVRLLGSCLKCCSHGSSRVLTRLHARYGAMRGNLKAGGGDGKTVGTIGPLRPHRRVWANLCLDVGMALFMPAGV